MNILKHKKLIIGLVICLAGLLSFILFCRTHLEIVNKGIISVELGEPLSQNATDYFDLKFFLPFEKEKINQNSYVEFEDLKYLDEKKTITNVGEYHGKIVYKDKEYVMKIIVADTTPPDIQNKSEVAYQQKEFQINDYITISDNSQQACEVIIDDSMLKVNQIGEYPIPVSATDVYGNKTQKEIIIKVVDKTGPSFKNINDMTIVNGSSFSPSENVEANDDLDGDCTNQIKINGQVDTKKNGLYTLEYSVTDKTGNMSKQTRKIYVISASQKIKGVPMILQNPGYYNGCESASTTMLLQYYGYSVSMQQIVNSVPTIALENHNGKLYGASPDEAFTGSMSREGYGVFAKPMTKVIQNYLDKNGKKQNAVNLTGADMDELLWYLDLGYPIQVWATASMTDAKNSDIKSWYVKTLDGQYTDQLIKFPYSEHCLVLTGYNQENVILNDPLQGVISVKRSQFEKAYQSMGNQAIIIKDR